MEVIIDGIVYVPKKTKLEMDILEEKYKSGDYIVIYYSTAINNWNTVARNRPLWDNNVRYKLIHKKHKNILDAWLADNSVEIEYEYSPNGEKNWWLETNFIDEYNEHNKYRLKQQYPIFKRNTNDVVIMLENDEVEYVDYVLTKHSKYIGHRWSKSNFNFSNFETIPYDKERGLYHLQPVWCWDDGHRSRATMFYDVELKMAIGFSIEKGNEYHWDNMEPITPEQLKTMPFVWEMYQQLLKDKQ